jgi:hypothetical protein
MPRPIDKTIARRVVLQRHYMKTYPNGAFLNLGLFDAEKLVGICVLGYSAQTERKVKKLQTGLSKKQYLEMQRLWISDDYGNNTESMALSKIMRVLRDRYNMQLIYTHAGGCKNDCGIVYQASGWLYLGRTECNDFYRTVRDEYKNIAAALIYGRVQSKNKTKQEIGEELFGPGQIVKSYRYSYVYPIHKGIRRRLTRIAQPFPKTSDVFRRNQQWIDNGAGEGR